MDCCETDGFRRPREIRGEPALSKKVRRRGVLKGAGIRRFYATGRLPLPALAIAPNRVAEINSFKDLEGRTVGLVSRGGMSEAQTLFLMKKGGADGKKVQFAGLGPNIYEPVRLGQ